MSDVRSELMHYGVLGMKWGVRKARAKEAHQKRVKASKDRDDKIFSARAKTAKYKTKVKTAKLAYKKATMDNGKEAAYKNLLKIKDQRMSNLRVAVQRTKREQIVDLFIGPYLYNQKPPKF